MAVFKVETKNKIDIDKKPRVYFTCHTDDFEKYFKKICADIFKTHDCAIYYTEDMTEIIDKDEKEIDLGRNNLFVVPVTFKLLTSPNRAMDEDIPYALKEHIPVLPIMLESGIDEFYSQPEKFGELQYLNPYSTDSTEISYEEKLKKYLEAVLISNEMAERIRAAFDAYIFLSYRKKDRKYANELMHIIHSDPECCYIAVWFDEFLTPGESFKENIEKILNDCGLFMLLVTPRLLEKVVDENGEEHENYVISTELPLAEKNRAEKGTAIVAVEVEKTDRFFGEAKRIYDYIRSNDAEFRALLLQAVAKIAVNTNHTPQHDFLIGLAYLEGIDVEINRQKGIRMIENVANAGFEEAIRKMIDIYINGNGVKKSYFHAKQWYEKYLLMKLNDICSADKMVALMKVYDEYCDFLSAYFVLEYCVFVNQTMLPQIKRFIEDHPIEYAYSIHKDLVFWLCKSYYRSVHADMLRDADNHNAKAYSERIQFEMLFIEDEDQLTVLNNCLQYLREAVSFWDNIDSMIAKPHEQKKQEERESAIDEMLKLVINGEKEYTQDPNEETLYQLISAYEPVIEYYEKIADLDAYLEYHKKYLILREKQFSLDPDVLDGCEIVLIYCDLVDRLIEAGEKDQAICIQRKYIAFLEYLMQIGFEAIQGDYHTALLLLANLLVEKGEHAQAEEFLVKAENIHNS